VLPRLKDELRNKDLRTWSAGCSSGEEPFTTAIVYDDFFGTEKPKWDTKILATDISPQVLSMAQQAIYPEERLQNLSSAWKSKYFVKAGDDKFRVCDKIRNEVIFGTFNLMETSVPFRHKFHIIFCRNVMIYFNKQTRDALVERFYDLLEPGGYLFIGLSETVSKTDTRFTFVQPSIYKKGS
jgi:chemotaxis protein methyltransferase CheR